MEDAKILDLYFAREETAIAETAAKYGGYCRSIALRILDCESDAAEVVNDTWLRLWNAIPPARPDPMKCYVGTVCRRLSLNRAEENTAQKRGGGSVPLLLDELEECVSGNDGDFGDEMALRDALNGFLASLPARTRVAFVQRYFYALPVSDVAKRAGTTENTAAVLLMRTRKKLRDYLEKRGFDL